jgi:hypothetical protein
MGTIVDMINDGELLVNYALENKIALAPGSEATLLAAHARLKLLETPGQDRDDFYAALRSAVDAVSTPVSALNAAETRRMRLAPLVRDAQSLLNYAAANGKKVNDEVRNPLIDVAESVARGTPDINKEQIFFKAYESLTTSMAPVTAETLFASQTVLPDWRKLFTKAGFWESCKDITIGRFFDAAVFIVILVVTCIAINYHSLGSTALERYGDLDRQLNTANTDLGKYQDLVTLRHDALERVPTNQPEAAELARKNVLDAQRQVSEEQALIERIRTERDPLADWLGQWSQLPCKFYVTSWALCPSIAEPSADKTSARTGKIQAAKTDISRLSEIVLPLLLGWLGAHAFVLRKMASDIIQRSFAKASSIHHIVRISLGALAGVASTWFLTPELVAGDQFKHLPPWALAFIAGYGIELVFAFMDRIIAAFTTRTP